MWSHLAYSKHIHKLKLEEEKHSCIQRPLTKYTASEAIDGKIEPWWNSSNNKRTFVPFVCEPALSELITAYNKDCIPEYQFGLSLLPSRRIRPWVRFYRGLSAYAITLGRFYFSLSHCNFCVFGDILLQGQPIFRRFWLAVLQGTFLCHSCRRFITLHIRFLEKEHY